MGGMAEVWEGWQVEILLVSSLLLQILLLVVTEWRRRVSWAPLSVALNGLLWLLYQLADSVAIYVLGHMSLSSKPHEQQQLMAFWASLLLVHLGGQDTITAYALEDNDLWLRHLFTLVVQAAGAAYVLYKYVASGSRELLAAAVLMFLVGVAKYGERIYALKSSGLDSISKFLDGFEVFEPDKTYPVPACTDDPEEVLQGAHDLLHVCMGQLVDYKVWPSPFQTEAISAYHNRTNPDGTVGRSMLLQLVGMQLSLMRDILYTKAAVIHTWYGFLSRIVSTVSTVVAFYLFRQSTMAAGAGAGSYSWGDMVATYILLAGAFFLEVASLSRGAVSTWTCAWLQATGWNRLHAALLYLRRGVKAAQRCRRWSGSIRQHDLLQFHRHKDEGACYMIAACFGLGHWWNRLRFFNSVVMSQDVEDLLLREVQSMVEASVENEHGHALLRQLTLGAWGTGGAGAGFYSGHSTHGVEDIGFDGSILAWHYATDVLLRWFDICCRGPPFSRQPLAHLLNMYRRVQGMSSEEKESHQALARAIRTLSRYMVFLLRDRPHLLPSPIRRSQYDSFCEGYEEFSSIDPEHGIPDVIRPAVDLANNMLAKCEDEDVVEVLRVVSRVWVEMLCYAASHCNNDSHARQLSSGTEFITVTWILTTALYNRFHLDDLLFLQKAQYFLERHERKREIEEWGKIIDSCMLWLLWEMVKSVLCCWN